MRILIATAVAVASLLVSAPAHAEAAAPSRYDSQFLIFVADASLFEIDGGALATTHSRNPEIRAFGLRMVVDHSKGLAGLRALARRLGQPLPTRPTLAQRAVLIKLRTLHGHPFDCAYAPAEVAGHIAVIAKFVQASSRATNPLVRASARAEIPTLRVHLALARRNVAHLRCP